MAPRVHTPVKDFTGTVAGVAFVKGAGESDDPAALAYFRRRGYEIDEIDEINGGVPPAGTPLTPEELARVAASASTPESAATPASTAEGTPAPPAPIDTGDGAHQGQQADPSSPPEKPHPVRDNKGAWFDYLSTVKPDHGFDLEKVARKELIDAVDELEKAATAA